MDFIDNQTFDSISHFFLLRCTLFHIFDAFLHLIAII